MIVVRPFSKILVANRGEIACRVMRTARSLGYRTVAVYSEPDADAPHVALADEAIGLGGASAADSYLRIDAVLEAARRSGADAIHPGYGFLSERADFAQACIEADRVFIGPGPEALRAMGDKAVAKRRMIAAGVPCVPGYLGEAPSDARLLAEACALGFPLLVKAVAGGGGRGMRLVPDAAGLPEALAGARREAEAAFGDGTLMLERLVEAGRHIEVQVFADAHGQVIHLGERDCTAQRRRQKVLEESPSPFVSPALREAMGRDAVAAARAVGYLGAGTVEFIVDAQQGHWFLEMNTRLQVEHPVTECVTGLDLVAWQLRVAAGEPLPLRQDEVRSQGHAIEARLYAEDPYDGFAPQTGRIAWWRPQRALGSGAAAAATQGLPAAAAASVRIDDGIAEGGEISPFYDALLAKLIVHGRDRSDAIRRLVAALEDAPLLGVATNGRFLRDLLRHPRFVDATMTTTLLDEWSAGDEPILRRPEPGHDDWCIAAAVRSGPSSARTTWLPQAAGVAARDIRLAWRGQLRSLRVRPAGDALQVALDGVERTVRLLAADDDGWRAIEVDGHRRRLLVRVQGEQTCLVRDAASFLFTEPTHFPALGAVADGRQVRAPTAGLVAQVLVQPGDRVGAGQALVCVEAMKMETWLHAGAAGTVIAVHAVPRAQVAAQAVLVEVQPDESPAAPAQGVDLP